MILLDYSAVAIANMMVAIKKDGEQLNEKFALHMILNSIRKINVKFSQEFDDMVICCDDRKNWRKNEFQYYKIKRKRERDKSDIDWDLIYKCLDYVIRELKKGFPYTVIRVDYAEADDIIGALSRYSTSNNIKTVIISSDKDFCQLHSDYVCQWRPCDKSFINIPDPKAFLKELIIRGDSEDSVPNIKSAYDHFYKGTKRQKPIYQKDVDIWIHDDDNTFLTEDTADNYYRNTKMIDLTLTPNDIKEDSVTQYINRKNKLNKSTVVKFFMKHQLRYLHEKIQDFF